MILAPVPTAFIAQANAPPEVTGNDPLKVLLLFQEGAKTNSIIKGEKVEEKKRTRENMMTGM